MARKRHGNLISLLSDVPSWLEGICRAQIALVFFHQERCRKAACPQCWEDREWIESAEDCYVFSFLVCCEVCQTSPYKLRGRFRRHGSCLRG